MDLPSEWKNAKVRRALRVMPHHDLLAGMTPAAEAQLRGLAPSLAQHQAAFEEAFPGHDPVAERYEILLVSLGHAVTSHRQRVRRGQQRLREGTGDTTQVLLDKAQLEVWCEMFEAAEAILAAVPRLPAVAARGVVQVLVGPATGRAVTVLEERRVPPVHVPAGQARAPGHHPLRPVRSAGRRAPVGAAGR